MFYLQILQLSLHKSNCNSLFKHSNDLIVLVFFCIYAFYDFRNVSQVSWDWMHHNLWYIKKTRKVDESSKRKWRVPQKWSFSHLFTWRPVKVFLTAQFRTWSPCFSPDRSVSNLIVHFRTRSSSFKPNRPVSNLIINFEDESCYMLHEHVTWPFVKNSLFFWLVNFYLEFFENHSCILLFNWFSFVWHCILWTFFWNFLQNSSILTASCTAFIFGWVHALGSKIAWKVWSGNVKNSSL